MMSYYGSLSQSPAEVDRCTGLLPCSSGFLREPHGVAEGHL